MPDHVGSSLRVQFQIVLILVSSLAIVLARFWEKNRLKKKRSLTSMRARALPSQLPVGLANDLGSTLFDDFCCKYMLKLWLQPSK